MPEEKYFEFKHELYKYEILATSAYQVFVAENDSQSLENNATGRKLLVKNLDGRSPAT